MGRNHSGGDPWQFSGDIAFYTGSISRYEVVQNVYVKAASENGAVERDSSGNVALYYTDAAAKEALAFSMVMMMVLVKSKPLGPTVK